MHNMLKIQAYIYQVNKAIQDKQKHENMDRVVALTEFLKIRTCFKDVG